MRLINLEGDMNFTKKKFQNRSAMKGQKAWALSVVPHFSLSPLCVAFLTWGTKLDYS